MKFSFPRKLLTEKKEVLKEMSEKVIDFSEVLNRVERKFVLLKDDSTQYANAVALMNAYMISLRNLYKPEKADFFHEPELYDRGSCKG